MGTADLSSFEEVWEGVLSQGERLVPPGSDSFFAVASCLRADALHDSDQLHGRIADADPVLAAGLLAGMWYALIGWNLDGDRPAVELGAALRRLAERPYVGALVACATRFEDPRNDCEAIAAGVRGAQSGWRERRGGHPTGPAALCDAVLVALEVGLPWTAEPAFLELLRAFRPPPGDVFATLVADGIPMADAARAASLVAA